jgi:hypothetical protein
VVFVVQAGTESAKRRIFYQDTSFGPNDHMLSQKVLVDIGADIFAGKKQPSAM